MAEPISLLFAGAAVAGVYYYNKNKREKQKQIWTEAALEVGGQFIDEPTSWYQTKKLQLRATLDGIGVYVDHYTVSTGKNSTIYTRLIAGATGTPHLKLSVHKEGFFSSLGKAFGTQDVIVGDQMFDDTFVIKASDETLCRYWIHKHTRDEMLFCPEYSFSIKGRETLATRVNIEENPQKLAAAIRAIAAFAGGGMRLVQHIQQTADILRGVASYEPNLFIPEKTQIEWQYKNFSCILSFAEKDQTLFQENGDVMTCIKLRHMGRGHHFYMTKQKMPKTAEQLPEAPTQDRNFGLEHRLRTPDPEVGALFHEENTERLLRLPFIGMTSDENFVTLWFQGLFFEPTLIEAACEAIAPFVTTPELDPYR